MFVGSYEIKFALKFEITDHVLGHTLLLVITELWIGFAQHPQRMWFLAQTACSICTDFINLVSRLITYTKLPLSVNECAKMCVHLVCAFGCGAFPLLDSLQT